jgi:D-arabinose 1-dehydrogenase-like Zn-dependent alcohol dehydrogenase
MANTGQCLGSSVYLEMVNVAQLQKGKYVLLTAATSSVGIAAIQIAKWMLPCLLPAYQREDYSQQDPQETKTTIRDARCPGKDVS